MMTLIFRTLAVLAVAAAAPVLAQTYPAHPVKIVVPYTAGGSSDFVGRTIATRLAEQMKQTFTVENKPGGNAQIGAVAVARAAPDGYTLLLMGRTTHVTAPSLYNNLPYDVMKDFTPIARVVDSPVAVVVHPDVPARTLQEFIGWVKANPGKVNYGSAGVGNTLHLAGELFQRVAGVKMTHVPYKGSSQAAADLLAGRIQVMFDLPQTPLPNIRAGKLRALAIAGTERVAVLPDVPTTAEAGLPGFVYGTWTGFAAPGGTPAPIVAQLHAEMNKAVANPQVQKLFGDMGMTVAPIESPQAFERFLREQIEETAKLIREIGITPQ